MPLLPLTSSDLTQRRQARTVYADYITQKQMVASGKATRVQLVGGSAGYFNTTESDLVHVVEGAVATTNDEQIAILDNIPKALIYAIPNFTTITPTFTSVTNPLPSGNNTVFTGSEDPLWTTTCVVTTEPISAMNGAYTMTASSYYGGTYTTYSPYLCFKRNSAGFWTTRTARNSYGDDGIYGTGGAINGTTINGAVVRGEWLTITAPYSFVLSSYTLVSGIHNTLPATSWVVAGSLDGGATYTALDVQSGITTSTNTFQVLSNKTAYNTYRIVITNIKASYIAGADIEQWDLFTYV